MMGDPRTLPGGNAQHYFASVKIEIKNKEILGADENSIETVDFNEHAFKIEKNKLGTSIRNGEFKMIRNPSSPLGQGFIDDGDTVVAYGRKFELITGGGSSWRVDGINQKFGKLEEIRRHLYSDLLAFEAFKNRMISLQRTKAGLAGEGWM